MFVNIINSYRLVVAACDKELIGNVFEEDNLQLNAKENFYKGEEKTKEEAIKIFQDLKKEDATFNLVGEKTTQAAIEAGIITKANIGKIAGIPYTLILL
jgi:hypothetical protein